MFIPVHHNIGQTRMDVRNNYFYYPIYLIS